MEIPVDKRLKMRHSAKDLGTIHRPGQPLTFSVQGATEEDSNLIQLWRRQ